MPKIQSVRGTHDLVGSDLLLYKKIEKNISKLAEIYDFDEIQTPIIENSDLFKKPLGEHSDVVLKEMYSFEDRGDSFLTLRPEYTVPIIESLLSNTSSGLLATVRWCQRVVLSKTRIAEATVRISPAPTVFHRFMQPI